MSSYQKSQVLLSAGRGHRSPTTWSRHTGGQQEDGNRQKRQKGKQPEIENRKRNKKRRLKLSGWGKKSRRKTDKAEEAPPSHLLLTHTFRVTFVISLYSGSIWHLPLRSEPCCAKRESRPFCSGAENPNR